MFSPKDGITLYIAQMPPPRNPMDPHILASQPLIVPAWHPYRNEAPSTHCLIKEVNLTYKTHLDMYGPLPR
jgi:hypothetical protein